jgi:hypothetical protein
LPVIQIYYSEKDYKAIEHASRIAGYDSVREFFKTLCKLGLETFISNLKKGQD